MLPVSVVVLCKNESERIGRCVQSVASWAQELIVVDSFSTDQTLAQVSKAWAQAKRQPENLKVYVQHWRGFLKTRNQSLSFATAPWVFWLDADEWVTDSLKFEFEKFFATPVEAHVFRISRQSEFLGQVIRHGGWFPDFKARLGRREFCEWRAGPNGADVHEDLFAVGAQQLRPKLPGLIGHLPFRSIAEQVETNKRYSELLGRALVASYKSTGRKGPSGLLISIKVIVKFVENYFFKLGFLDGRAGFVIAKGSAQSLRMRLKVLQEGLKS